MVKAEIKNKSQWKLEIDGQVACVWATTLKDELIWGKTTRLHFIFIVLRRILHFEGRDWWGKF